jgi:hypothetical protein
MPVKIKDETTLSTNLLQNLVRTKKEINFALLLQK